MRVDQAFAKAGFQITEATKGKDQITFSVRVPTDPAIIAQRWSGMLAQILVVAEEVASKPTKKWEIDISKRFFAKHGGVRWMWRIVMSGDVKACQAALTTATINSLRIGNEISQVPLVGQTSMEPDPKNGKFKGSYPRNDDDRASAAVAAAFVGG